MFAMEAVWLFLWKSHVMGTDNLDSHQIHYAIQQQKEFWISISDTHINMNI